MESKATTESTRSYPSAPSILPKVGDGATICYWTDRHACTVVSVSPTGTRVGVTRDIVKRTDDRGMDECQTYEFTTDPDAPVIYFTWRPRRGAFVKVGERASGLRVHVGSRREYHAFSF